jgi:S1-C subfamily serine protease
MIVKTVLAILTLPVLGYCQNLTQQQACAKFSSAIVAINAGGVSHGSGFLVSSNGYILTAAHVVRDGSGYYSAIDIALSTGEHLEATPAIQLTIENVGQDYALLKVATKHELPFLILGNTSEVTVGADGTIIGFPFSAISATGGNITTKFCLTASFGAVSNEVHPVSGTKGTGANTIPFNTDVHVDVIYFQGPSIKGLSGSPVISRDSGHVVGILSTKLTGISSNLEEIGRQLTSGPDIGLGSVSLGKTSSAIIDTLDRQLANGLGSAVGVEEAARDLHHAQSKH